MRLAPFGGNTRSLEGSSTSRDGAECPGRALVAWGGGASVCLSMGNVGRGAWVSPRGVYLLQNKLIFYKLTISTL